MYQPYPTSGVPQEQQPLMQAPDTVRNAVKLMYVGAGLSAVAVIISLVTIGSLKSAILSRDPNFTTSQVHAAEGIGIGAAIVGGLIAIGLWLWMAWANKRGRNWARVVSAVFFGINTLDLLLSFARVHAVLTVIFGVLVWLVGLAAIVLIYNKKSAPYYRQPPLQG